MTSEAKRPNPGSDEAIKLGCICPVLDNCHGKWAPWPPDGWWILVGCPVHYPQGEDEDETSPHDLQDE